MRSQTVFGVVLSRLMLGIALVFFSGIALPVLAAEGDVPMNQLVFSPDSTWLAGACRDGQVRIWDARTGEVKPSLRGEQITNITNVVFTPDGKELVVVRFSGVIERWSLADGKLLKSITLPPQGERQPTVSTSTLLPNGTLVVACSNSTLVFVDLQTGTVSEPAVTTEVLISLTVSPDGRQLAAGGTAGNIQLWDLATRKQTRTLKGRDRWMNFVAYSKDGKMLYSACAKGVVQVWDLAQAWCVQEFQQPSASGTINQYALYPDGQALAGACRDGKLRIWAMKNGAKMWETDIATRDARLVQYSPNAYTLACADSTGAIKFFWNK